jgi:hypothetical protein
MCLDGTSTETSDPAAAADSGHLDTQTSHSLCLPSKVPGIRFE